MVDKYSAEDGIIHDMGGHAIVSIFKAGANITKDLFVKVTADGPPVEVQQAAASGKDVIGVALDTVSSGDMAPVAIYGIVKVEAGGTIARGDLVTSDANGKAVKYSGHTHTENTAASYTQNATTQASPEDAMVGKALQSASSGDKILIKLF